MKTISTHELAWAAGFFDGEGSVCLRRRGNWRELWLQVAQSGDPAILYRFQQAVGGLGRVGGPWRTKKGKLPAYRLDAHGYVQVQAIIAMLWRFLSEPKRVQATTAMINCRDYFAARALHGKSTALFTLKQVALLREEYDAVRQGRLRAPKGWIADQAKLLGAEYYTIAHILGGHGYARPHY